MSDANQAALRRHGWWLAGAWTLAVAVSLVWTWHWDDDATHELALANARLAVETLLTDQNFAMDHDDPFAGRSGTVAIGARSQLSGHLASAKASRPEVAPDPWEAQSLATFAAGAHESETVTTVEGRPTLRMMKALVIEDACLPCHGQQGAQIGEVHGGLSVSIPLGPYLDYSHAGRARLVLRHALGWVLGLLGIWWSAARLLSARRQADAESARAADALERSARRFRTLFENSHDALMTLAPPSWRFTSGNPAAIQLFGAGDEGGFLARAPWQYWPDVQPDGQSSRLKATEMIEAAMTEGSCYFEWTHQRLSGETFPATVLLTRLEVDGQPALQAAVRDVTAEKQRAQDLREADARARHAQKLEAIATLASGAAHEINNPLAVMMNFGQLILDDEDNPPTAREFAAQIVDHGERAAAIVRGLLAFSRHDQRSFAPAATGDLVENVLSLVRADLETDGIVVQTRIADDVPPVACNGQQIQQVLLSLVTNARDALTERFPGAHDDKILTVIVSRLELDGHDWVRTTVEDRGSGIAPGVASRVFEPFFSTKPKHKGAGLDLSVAHGIVAEHGGRLWFESEPGVGTRFHLDLEATTRA